MAKVRSRTVYTTSDGHDFDDERQALYHERKIVISEFFIEHEKAVGELDLRLTERQAQALVRFLAKNIDQIHLKLDIDRLF